MTESRTDWTAGVPCAVHELAYCADCRDAAGMRRALDGQTVYTNDCAVQTFAEITSASYDEAVSYLREAGFRPGSGTPKAATAQAFAAVGFNVTEKTALGMAWAIDQSATAGRVFYVSADKGKRGHAWSIVNGATPRAFRSPFRYRIFEVTA
jgi:hypothetical protein